jgi:hypothetical protein
MNKFVEVAFSDLIPNACLFIARRETGSMDRPVKMAKAMCHPCRLLHYRRIIMKFPGHLCDDGRRLPAIKAVISPISLTARETGA